MGRGFLLGHSVHARELVILDPCQTLPKVEVYQFLIIDTFLTLTTSFSNPI